jgi:chromosome partitioning protein
LKIASIWNPKGGQGKTTITLNLAAAASKLGLATLVISRDIQDDDMSAFGRGEHPFTILQSLPPEKPNVDLVLIDYPAGYRERPDSHVVVCPVVPCRLDYAAYIKAKPILDGCDIIEICNRGDMRRKDERDFILFMRKDGASVVRSRAVFINAHNQNKTIFDSAFAKTTRIGESKAEIEGVLARVLNQRVIV